ncbi:PREDICTED: uncharacterized protein LOC108561258 [Nicrophorus vespilloides]|uniref:Uncharacterized protein LOC108561258 n=1 Tax=Nicrophorus vespilloides TaxID=110193 RepID=A0ABM1MJ58_NICVS|nr:PREDICTED: uncharacterized protein LOC108561258 [Nicrophorus vespilloides]
MALETKTSSHRQINESGSRNMVEGNGETEFVKVDGHEGEESTRTSSNVINQKETNVLEHGNEEVDSKTKNEVDAETLVQEKSVKEISTDNAALSKIDAIKEPSVATIGSEVLQVDDEETENLEVAINEEHSVEKQESEYQEIDVTFSLLIKEEEEVVEEECFEEEEATPVILDREPYYPIFQKSIKDYGTVKRLNQYLQHKLSVYFIKREMTHILKESEHYAENSLKYKMKLDQFHDLINRDREERQKVTQENKELKELRDRLKMESAENYASLQQRERETGTGLIFTKTGKEMSEKVKIQFVCKYVIVCY